MQHRWLAAVLGAVVREVIRQQAEIEKPRDPCSENILRGSGGGGSRDATLTPSTGPPYGRGFDANR